MPTNTEAPERQTLTRYDLKYTENSEGVLVDAVLEEAEEGEFVKYADIRAPAAAA